MNYARPMRYRPMLHPHFVPALTQALGALGADQGDLFAVDWEAVKKLGDTYYSSALLAVAQGAALQMPQATIDTAINTILVRHKALNLFRGLFGLYPLSVKGYIAERDKLVRDAPADWEWFRKTNDGYTLRRELLQTNKGAHEVTAAELEQLAKAAGWTDKQVKDALTGKNVLQLKTEVPPWARYAMIGAGAVLVWYLLRQAS